MCLLESSAFASLSPFLLPPSHKLRLSLAIADIPVCDINQSLPLGFKICYYATAVENGVFDFDTTVYLIDQPISNCLILPPELRPGNLTRRCFINKILLSHTRSGDEGRVCKSSLAVLFLGHSASCVQGYLKSTHYFICLQYRGNHRLSMLKAQYEHLSNSIHQVRSKRRSQVSADVKALSLTRPAGDLEPLHVAKGHFSTRSLYSKGP